MKEEQASEHISIAQEADQVEIIYYTDPLCCWSWAFEPQWRKLRYEFAGKIRWKYVMGGLLPGWKNYHDEINSVSRPAQMGPIWMEASYISGMPMPTKIWISDPPATSYLACIAVKCAQLQSAQIGEMYLRRIREAVMLEGRNISKQDVLIEAAAQIAKENHVPLDLQRFRNDMSNDNGLEAFRKDMHEVQVRNINRFPSLVIRQPGQQAVIITGYRPYDALLAALKQIAPGIEKVNTALEAAAYQQYWGSVTQKEIDEAIAKS